VPRLCPDLDLIGEYKGSGFKETPYLVRRPDGQVLQLSRLLFVVAGSIDGRRTVDEVAAVATEEFGRKVSGDNVEYLIEKKLTPLGIALGPDGRVPDIKKPDPLLALRYRAGVVPERAVRAITTIFKPLFFAPVILAVLAGLVLVDGWVFFRHGLAQGIREVVYHPGLTLLVLLLIVLSAAAHEIGHATGCAYGGATPGVMGVGLYIVWPAFYTDVTDAYRLDKRGRLRTDLGGVYFNCVFILATAGLYFLTHFEPLLLVILLQHIEMLHQFLPFLRLDGYYMVADATGVPDLFSRMKPILRSMAPWRETEQPVEVLKPRVRLAVTVWVLLAIPALLYVYALMVLHAPRIIATVWDSAGQQFTVLGDALGGGRIGEAALSVVQLVALVLPAVGLVLILVQSFKRAALKTWQFSEGRPVVRAGLAAAAVAGAVFAVLSLLPRPDAYRPIQPGERWTIASASAAAGRVSTFQPGFAADPAVTEGTGSSGSGGSSVSTSTSSTAATEQQPGASSSSSSSSSSSTTVSTIGSIVGTTGPTGTTGAGGTATSSASSTTAPGSSTASSSAPTSSSAASNSSTASTISIVGPTSTTVP
jgi:putative peptide zinc metalloprotease protein